MNKELKIYLTLLSVFLTIALFYKIDSGEYLSFWGGVLGAMSTIIAVIATINYSRKQSQESFKQAQKIEWKNRMIDECFFLIDSCNIQKVAYGMLNSVESNIKIATFMRNNVINIRLSCKKMDFLLSSVDYLELKNAIYKMKENYENFAVAIEELYKKEIVDLNEFVDGKK